MDLESDERLDELAPSVMGTLAAPEPESPKIDIPPAAPMLLPAHAGMPAAAASSSVTGEQPLAVRGPRATVFTYISCLTLAFLACVTLAGVAQ